MTSYLLDTSTCVESIRGKSAMVTARLRQCEPEDVFVSTITVAELEFGVVKSRSPSTNSEVLARMLATLNILPFDGSAATEYGRVRAELEQAGTPIGALDTLIAAHARALSLTLVTANESEFRRVNGLQVENWTR